MEFGDCSLWHHLIFCDELASDADNDNVRCPVCRRPVFGCPFYKCLECNFLIHASCAHKWRYYYTSHERHHLIYVEEGENEYICVGCGEPASGPTYECVFGHCGFRLHKSCTHLSRVTRYHHAEQPDHISTLQLREVETCEVCGHRELHSLLFYRCPICHFTIDMKCFARLQISAEDHHPHALIPLLNPISFSCQACGGHESKVRAHVCTGCGVLIHRDCGEFPPIIKVFSHNHTLNRTYSIFRVKKQDPIFCNLCYKKVNIEGGAYYCRQCDYIVHMKCANSVEDKRRDGNGSINFNEYKAHVSYLVEGLNGREGETTSPSEIKHFSHQQHELILSYEEPLDEKRCEACALLIIFAPFYSCQDCSFFLHCKCAKLPPTITRGPFHEHPLEVVTTAPFMELFWCDFCRQLCHGFAYACKAGCREHRRHGFAYPLDECGIKLDVQCLFIPEKLNHESHTHPLFLMHPLFLIKNYSDERCNGCGGKWVKFRCTDCQFNLCWKCVILPFMTRHPYDLHLLKLTYRCKDESGEYYCFICKEKRDSNVWFYYCEECDFAAHIQCTLGKRPHVKYGSTVHKENHQHPLKFVQTMEELARCAFCDGTFWNGVALECNQCNIQIHYDCKMLWLY